MVMVARRRSAAHTLLSSPPLLDEGIPLEVAQRALKALGVLTALASPPPSRGGGIKTETRALSMSANVCDQFSISANDAQLVLFVSPPPPPAGAAAVFFHLRGSGGSLCGEKPPAPTSQLEPRHINQGPRPKHHQPYL